MTADNLEQVEVDVPAVLAVQVPGESACDPPSIARAMGAAFGTLMGCVERCALTPSGPPRAIYTAYSADSTTFIVAIPVAAPPAPAADLGPASVGTIPGRKALRFTHRGPYSQLMATYNQITQALQAQGLLRNEADWARYMPMWEEYLNDPETTPEAELLTYIYLPLS